MNRCEELDRSRWLGPPEPDNVPMADSYFAAKLVSLAISSWAKENRMSLSDAKMLSLGAGQGGPEVSIINKLGIDPANATFVDKNFKKSARDRFSLDFPALTIIKSGMFAFLENPKAEDFSLVTALGIEYVLEDDADTMRAFISRLSNVTKTGGLVIVFPYSERPLTDWQENGFKPLTDGTT